MTDCLIIGFNDTDFTSWVEMVRSMGETSGAFRDLNLAYAELDGRPYRSMDLLNRFHFGEEASPRELFSNTDFLWPTITYLGSYLHRRGFSFDYVNQFHLEKDLLAEKLEHDEILTVAITTTLYVSPHPVLEIISFIRRHSETVKILVGGPYVSNQVQMADADEVQKLFKYLGADIYVISQEGEGALVNILTALKSGGDLGGIDNIAYRSGDGYAITQASVERNPLVENPIDYSLFPAAEIGELVSLRTAKSCPFACSFCGFPQRAGKYQYNAVDLVEDELNRLADLGTVTTLTFLDDTFNVPKKRFKEILQMMIRNRYGFRWNSFYRSDHGDPEIIELMAEAGCEGVFLGIESGSDEMLKVMNKTARRRHYLEAIPLLQQVGISAHANFIVGFPTETPESVEESVALVEEVKPDFFRAQLWYCDPVTPIWNRRHEFGVEGSGFNWRHDSMDCDTACDLIDRIFLSVEGSIWLPQNGFEQWSTFYLQRKGMSLDRIKSFLRCFNAAVREQLLFPHKRTIDPELLATLAASCRFPDREEPELESIEVYDGSRYRQAEAVWGSELHGYQPQSSLGLGTAEEPAEGAEWERAPVLFDGEVVGPLLEGRFPSPAPVLCAAFSILLSRLGEHEDVVIAVGLVGEPGRPVVPLRLRLEPGSGFGQVVDTVADKLRRLSGESRFAVPILSNPYRMAEQEAGCPVFEAGLVVLPGQTLDPTAVEELRSSHPQLARELRIVLTVAGGEPPRVELACSPETSAELPAAELAATLADLVGLLAAAPDRPLSEVGRGREGRVPESQSTDAREVFNF